MSKDDAYTVENKNLFSTRVLAKTQIASDDSNSNGGRGRREEDIGVGLDGAYLVHSFDHIGHL